MNLSVKAVNSLLSTGGEPDGDDPFVVLPPPEVGQSEGAAAIDLRLGCWFVALRRAKTAVLGLGDQVSEAEIGRTSYVPYNKAYILHPGSFVLGTTMEWIRLSSELAGYVVGRSSWGRRGLIIATATGVHPGFSGCLTLELTNVGETPIEIAPGVAICQLFLHEVREPSVAALDKSQFIAQRKPTIGHVDRDDFAKKLFDAHDR